LNHDQKRTILFEFSFIVFVDLNYTAMQPVIKFNKKSPQIDHSFFRCGDSCPIIISIIGGIHSGKTHLINSLLSLSWQHSHRRYQHEVFGAVRSSPGADLVALEWQLELHLHSLKDVRDS
jgi:hypothetical protein